MNWFETLRSRIARAREEHLLPQRLRHLQKQTENVALRIREAFLRGTSTTQEAPGDVTNIGKSVSVKGELASAEDVIIEGRMEGKIELKDHNLVVGPNARINAQINARNVIVMGKVVGNIQASRSVEIKAPGSVMGDINSSRIATEDGARFKGSVDIQKRRADATEQHNSSKAEAAQFMSDRSSGKNS